MNDPAATLKALPEKLGAVRSELGKRIFGQQELIDQLLAAVIARGHALLTGVPGLAKTLLIGTLADCCELLFHRIQFTPDMMPSDITGSEVLDFSGERREFQFQPGPVFANLILADEINRTPPKTQAALLEAMQERSVTVAGKRHALPSPFFVLATRNPIEQEGTYPLPEAQLDRFMFSLNVDYPELDDEVRIIRETTGAAEVSVSKVLSCEDLTAFQEAVRHIPVPHTVAEYAAKIVRATRPGNSPFAEQYVRWGAGPRAGQSLALAGKAFAALDGRFNVSDADIRRALLPVLRHRVMFNYRADADGVTLETLLDEILKGLK